MKKKRRMEDFECDSDSLMERRLIRQTESTPPDLTVPAAGSGGRGQDWGKFT